jgi:hypothetical protein
MRRGKTRTLEDTVNAMNRAMVWAVTFCIITFTPAALAGVAGSYQAVTESEWAVDLSLNPDGSALIEIASWLPGESEKAKVEKHKGTWTAEGSNVTVRVPGGQIAFVYVARLSFASFGRKGAAPGLRGVTSTFEPTLFVKRPLWLIKELNKLKWEVTD